MMVRLISITVLITVGFASVSAAQDAPAFSALSPSSLELLAASEPAPDRAFTAQAVPTRKKDSRLNGFLIGAAVGAVPGVLLGVGFRSWCVNELGSNCDVWVPVTGASFALIGGGIGYAIDGAIGQSLTFGRPRPSPGVRFSVKF
jgi:hypothetical protein